MAWKEYRSERKSDVPSLRIGTHKNGSLNSAAYRLLGEPERVVLMFDESRRAIGIRAAHKDDTHSQRLADTNYSTSFMGFCKEHGIASPCRLDGYEKDGVLVFHLEAK